eukprot:4298103-Alexandrium_andersonii.AAC.1
MRAPQNQAVGGVRRHAAAVQTAPTDQTANASAKRLRSSELLDGAELDPRGAVRRALPPALGPEERGL